MHIQIVEENIKLKREIARLDKEVARRAELLEKLKKL